LEKKINKKKICFVQPRAYYLFNQETDAGKDKVGGAQTQTFYLSTGLAKKNNFDVHFLVADFGQEDFEIRNKVKIWKSFNFNNNIFKKSFDLFRTLKTINADIYIFRSADLGVAIASFYTKFVLQKKLFYMLASDVETSYKQSRQMSGILRALSMSFVYKFADTISVQSETQYNLFLKHRNKKPSAIIRNIIHLPKQNETINKNYILWIGRLEKIKNPELFIELAKKYPDKKFVMIAPIIRDAVNYGKKIKANILNEKNIIHNDFVAPNNIKNYYEQSVMYVITSHQEGFSNTMAEAMANRCPVLSFNVNPDEIFTKHKAGSFANGSKEKFFNQFEELLINKDLSMKFRKNALKYIKKNHDKDTIINTFIQLLK